MKSLALASKVKSLALASRPQVLENWPVLGSRTALFFEMLKFCEALENFFGKRFFVEIARKIFVKTFFFFFLFWRSPKHFCDFGEHLRLYSWSLALASSIPVFGLESVCPRKDCPWPWPRFFFLCPWPWPRALCPRLHLWYRVLWFWREDQNSEFTKTFFGGYLFVFVECLCKRSPKIKTKNIKNYSSILAIVNHRKLAR